MMKKMKNKSVALLREPLDPDAPPVMIDATTGLAAHAIVFESDLFFNLFYDYFDGTWTVYLPTEMKGRHSKLCDHDGMYVRDVLLPKVVANELLSAAAADQQNRLPEQHRALLRLAAASLQTDIDLRKRVLRRIEWLKLWHSPPSPPIESRLSAIGHTGSWASGSCTCTVVDWCGAPLICRLSASQARMPQRRRRDCRTCGPPFSSIARKSTRVNSNHFALAWRVATPALPRARLAMRISLDWLSVARRRAVLAKAASTHCRFIWSGKPTSAPTTAAIFSVVKQRISGGN